jgi:hypothetical protein
VPLLLLRQVDWYFFGHGIDYAEALSDFASIAGAVPIPRRHFLGLSWSKWSNSITTQVRKEHEPLCVCVCVCVCVGGFALTSNVWSR